MDLEVQARDQRKVIDLQEHEIGKIKEEIKTYQQMLEVGEPTIPLIDVGLREALKAFLAGSGPKANGLSLLYYEHARLAKPGSGPHCSFWGETG